MNLMAIYFLNVSSQEKFGLLLITPLTYILATPLLPAFLIGLLTMADARDFWEVGVA